MPALIWLPDTLADIERLHDFLAQTKPTGAQRGAAAIIRAARRIQKNPYLGTTRAEFRELPAKFGRREYVLRYMVLPNADILIVRVWHSREQR